MKRLHVVYIHMIGAFGGSSRSLYEAVRMLVPEQIQATFITQRGTVRSFFSSVGTVIEARGISRFDNLEYSYYRGVRWLVLLREIAYLPGTLLVLWRARKTCRGADIVHLNELTGLIALWFAKRWFSPRATVVHVRSVARADTRSWRTRWVNSMLRKEADAVIAIDENVRASLPSELPVDVIHNGFSARIGQPDESVQARLGGLRAESFKVGFVGNLLAVKGIRELIEAVRIVRARGVDLELIVVGGAVRSSRGIRVRLLQAAGLWQDMHAEVEEALDRYRLRPHVHMVGFTADLARVYQRMDVLCFPSHYDAPGRPIFEAAFFGVPSIVAVRDPRPDTLIDGVTGVAIEPRSQEQLAAAIERLARDRTVTRRMGEAARRMAESNFDVERNAATLLEVYRRVVQA